MSRGDKELSKMKLIYVYMLTKAEPWVVKWASSNTDDLSKSILISVYSGQFSK